MKYVKSLTKRDFKTKIYFGVLFNSNFEINSEVTFFELCPFQSISL